MKKIKFFSFITALLSLSLVFSMAPKGTTVALNAENGSLGSPNGTVNVTHFRIWDIGLYLTGGDQVSVRYNVYPENATNKNIIWTSTDETLATVDDNGVVTAKYKAEGQCKVIGTTEDGNFTDFVWINVSSNITQIKDTSFPRTSDNVNKYTIEGKISKIVNYDSKQYFLISDGTGSLVLVNDVNYPIEEGKCYSIDCTLSFPSLDLYAGSAKDIAELTDGTTFEVPESVTSYSEIIESDKPQVVKINEALVGHVIQDTNYSPILYQLGDKEIYAYHTKVAYPGSSNFDNCPIYGKYLDLDGILVPYRQTRADYRLVFIPNETYKLATVDVKYFLDRGEGNGFVELTGQAQTFVVGDTISTPDILAPEGKKLLGWSDDNVTWKQFDFSKPTEGPTLELYAKIVDREPVTVTFMNGADVYFIENGLSGFTLTEPVVPKRDGKIFVGWSTDSSVAKNLLDFSQVVTMESDATYYAIFRDPYDIRITFDVDGVSSYYDTKEGICLDQIPYEKPTKDGYVFSGWYKDEECTILLKTYEQITASLTLFAGFREHMTCKVTFRYSSNNKLIKELNVKEESKIPNDSNLTAVSSTTGFNCWLIPTETGFTKVNFNEYVVQSDCVIYAFFDSTDLFNTNSIKTQLYLNYTTLHDYQTQADTYELNSASIHFGFLMTYAEYRGCTAGSTSLNILYGTSKTFDAADTSTKLTFNSLSERIEKIDSSFKENLAITPGITQFGYGDLGFKCKKNISAVRVDKDGNPDSFGDYVQFGITIANFQLKDLDTGIYVAAYGRFDKNVTKYIVHSSNNAGETFRGICQRYVQLENAEQLYGDHLGVLNYLANYGQEK